MSSADIGVIGHTGFVGSTIVRLSPGALGYNSSTVGQAFETRFRTLFCAAAPGSMFEANKYPERDAARIDDLIQSLSHMQADQFVLISTIAVLDRFDGCYTEGDARFQDTTPYGANRRRLELACQKQFPNCLIVRLPALFGQGLAKNFIFDLLNPMPTMLNASAYDKLVGGLQPRLLSALNEVYSFNSELGMQVIDRTRLAKLADQDELAYQADRLGVNAVMFHHRDTTFQFYEMSKLIKDINIALDAHLDVVHLAPSPVKTADIYRALIGGEMPETNARPHAEDMRTLHSRLWGAEGPYIREPDDVVSALNAFFKSEGGA